MVMWETPLSGVHVSLPAAPNSVDHVAHRAGKAAGSDA